MIENVIVTKLGSESDSLDNTVFTSTTPWSDNAADLIVYRNGVLQVKSQDYSSIDSYTIKFNYSVEDGEQVQMLITRLSSDNFNRDRIIQLDRVNKKLENKTQTTIDKQVFEEELPTSLIIHSKDVWSDDINPDPTISMADGTIRKMDLILDEDITVRNHCGWFASSNHLISSTVKNWILPKFGRNYIIRLYDGDNVEIPSSDPMGWHWDYSSGYLTISNSYTRSRPFKVSGYVYQGRTGGAGSEIGSGVWREPVQYKQLLPTANMVAGEVRLVIDESQLYRYDGVKWVKIYNNSSFYKDPVNLMSDLPLLENQNGDFRLVLSENSIYRWSSSTNEWLNVLNRHNHDDLYYRKSAVDSAIARASTLQVHTHDNLYYRKEEVNQLVRWRPSVANYNLLPPYTENLDGDVILTRDTNTIWRFDYFGNPARWIAITNAQSVWKDPVQNLASLPTINNRVGDARLVLDIKLLYFWDGTQWYAQIPSDHNHDSLYYTKTYIDALNFNWKSPVTKENTLPTSGNASGDVRMTLDTLNAYFWDGTTWTRWTASPKWREPVATSLLLPTFGNRDSEIRLVKSENYIYIWDSITNTWKPLSLPNHTHDDLYYTKIALDSGQLDTRYYTKTVIDDKFNSDTGHDHDGVNSKRVDYNNLLNIPYFYWKQPVVDLASFPTSGNELGDVRISILEENCYAWNGTEWRLIGEGTFAQKDHEHDARYYQKLEVDVMIQELSNDFNSQLMTKADKIHFHDDRYYQKSIVDSLIQDRFDLINGHNHNGKNSRQISYYDLLDIPSVYMTHNHDERYYTKTELQTAGQSQVDWINISNKPDLGNTHWKSPVQTVLDLPTINNEVGDIRLVLNDSDIYEWVGNQWLNIGHWDNKYIQYWREPVDTYQDLPIIQNVDGDVRLVLSENIFYRWNQLMRTWIVVLQTESDALVFLNGDQLFGEGVEWVRIREKEVQLAIPAKAGDQVSLILKYDYKTQRKDFLAYSGQTLFNFATGYYREDFLAAPSQTVFVRQHSFIKDGNALLVWLNGLLQRVGIDFRETDAYTFEFLNPCEQQDRVITISLDHASGEGEYIREDYIVSEPTQKDFILLNAFALGGGNLIVFLNGLLQRPNADYKEVNNSKIEFYNACKPTDYLTFIIFFLDAVKGCCDADQIALGNASDRDWADGLFPFYPEYKVANALDDLNQALLEIAPPKPRSLQSLAFTSENITLSSGYESIGNNSYEGIPGIYRNYLTEDGNFQLFMGDATSISDSDNGILSMYINNIKVDEFNLYNAFVENNRKEIQTSMNYGIQTNGARFDEGLPGTNGALRNSSGGRISIMSVVPHNGFSIYQRARIRLNISQDLLRSGYNYIHLTHSSESYLLTSLQYKLFYDSADTRPEFIDDVHILEFSLTSQKYVSGIRYYSIGDQFRTDYNITSVYNNSFSQISTTMEMPGLSKIDVEYNDPNIRGVSEKPVIGEILNYNGEFRLNKYGDYSINANLHVESYDPFGTGEIKDTYPVNRLVNTYTNGSTDKIEYFRDEVYRLLPGDFDIIPTNKKNVWNSRDPLLEGNAMLFDMKLSYANKSFSDYKPAQTVDYSAFSQQQTYFRSFYDRLPHNNGTLVIRGISEDNLIKNKLLIDIKLPTQTGWLSLNKNYDVITYQGVDGDGCLLRSQDQNFLFSTGRFSTARSGYVIIVRITINNSSPNVSYMELI